MLCDKCGSTEICPVTFEEDKARLKEAGLTGEALSFALMTLPAARGSFGAYKCVCGHTGVITTKKLFSAVVTVEPLPSKS